MSSFQSSPDPDPQSEQGGLSGLTASLGERKNLVIAAVVGAVVVLGLGGYFLVFAGGSSSGSSFSGLVAGAHAHAPGSGGAAGAASPAGSPTTLPPVFAGNIAKNPFAPFYPPASTASATSTTPVGSTPTATPTPH